MSTKYTIKPFAIAFGLYEIAIFDKASDLSLAHVRSGNLDHANEMAKRICHALELVDQVNDQAEGDLGDHAFRMYITRQAKTPIAGLHDLTAEQMDEVDCRDED